MNRRALVLALCLFAGACSAGGPATTSTTAVTTTTGSQATTTTTTATTEATTTTSTTAPSSPWTEERSPALGPGTDEWNSNYVVPGPVIAVDGTYHMLFTGYRLEGITVGRGTVGAAVSGEGAHWTIAQSGALLDASGVTWAEAGIVATSALVRDDGTWVVYFNTVNKSFGPGGMSIGMATAPGAAGPWTVHPDPVLSAGTDGDWDGGGVSHPSVIATDGGYLMWYDGWTVDSDETRDRMIGIARSADGVQWVKDPSPVLAPGAGGSWDEFRVMQPSVVEVGSGLVMVYATAARFLDRPGLFTSVGYATSPDGATWTRAAEPVFTTKASRAYVYSTSAAVIDDVLVVFVDKAGSLQSPSSAIYRVTAPLPLP